MYKTLHQLALSSLLFVSSAMSLASEPRPVLLVSREELTLEGAMFIAKTAQQAAKKLNKTVSLAVVGAQGETMVLLKGDGVGPHNTEAARRKAYTALSTKTATLKLMRSVKTNPDTVNLASLPELLLLSGGHPILKKGVVIGAIGVAGGGSPENDDLIASTACTVVK